MSNLEKMTGHTRLYRRNATYYHRASVPTDIAETYGKVEETFSLRTKDRTEALRLVRIKAVEVDGRFEAHRKELARSTEPYLEELSEDQIKHVGEVYYASLLADDDDTWLEGFDDLVDTEEACEWVSDVPDSPRTTFEEYIEGIKSFEDDARYELARGIASEFTKDETEDILSWDSVGHKLSKGSPSWPLLYRERNKSVIRACEAWSARNKGDVIETPKVDWVNQVQTPSSPPIQTPSASDYPQLSIAIEQWVRDTEHGWSPKTKNGNIRWVHDFLEICGDRPLDQYSKADGRLFKETFGNLPPNWRIRTELKGLHIDQASKKAGDLNLKTMSHENINKGIGKVTLFWTWADNHYFDGNAPQPLKGLKYRLRRNPRDERNPFSHVQLAKIFNAPIFTGCKSETHWSASGSTLLKQSPKFWVPLIGLFTGARLAEICQLEIADIETEGPITYFDFNGVLANERKEGEKGIKTANSERKVPVHPTLLKLGLLEYIKQTKTTGTGRMFPSIKIGADGSYSDHFSKHFRRFLNSCDAKTDKTSFHSFRHNFEDACGNAQIIGDVRDTLQGHSSEGMRGRYGSREIDLGVLQSEMNKIEYRELDLSHLFRS